MRRQLSTWLAALMVIGCWPWTGLPALPGERASAEPTVAEETYYPLQQTVVNRLLPGLIGGVGMLAKYDDEGPESVRIRRTTTPASTEPFAPITLARVFGPDGELLAVEELTDQSAGTTETIIALPPGGEPGIYRVSLSGGRSGDVLEIGLPDTPIWGVRGEMALSLGSTLPSPAYVYLPRTTEAVVLEALGGATVELFDALGQSLGSPAASGSRRLLTVEPAAADEVWRLELNAPRKGAIVFDGVPGLLTPSPAAALALKGGTAEADGLLVAGPLQARVREAMVDLATEPLAVNLDFFDEVPDDLEHPILEALHYGKYGFIMGSASPLSRQVLDPSNPYYGAITPWDPDNPGQPRPLPPTWESSLYPKIFSTWDPLNMAAAVSIPGELNPAYDHEGLRNRATLGALHRLVMMQGDDYIRENDLRSTANPLTHAFFAYYTVAHTYYLLHDSLDPAVDAVFREALIAAGDRMGDYKGYQSNQWLHTIEGHLFTYMATGEPRFLGYFERMITSYVDGTHGAASKFGQHPAGYYLEEYGADGHYGAMNDTMMLSIYYRYRELPGADPVLTAKLYDSIERALEFQQYYWLPQPSGTANNSAMAPSAMSTRTQSRLGIASYPGMYMAHPDFPLGRAKYEMINDPLTGPGDAMTFAHLINNDDWALRLLEWALPLEDQQFAESNTSGGWISNLYHIYSQSQQAQAATLPVYEQEGTWTLPGHVAWKRGGLYGVVFYEVEGASSIRPQSKVGGGPSAFWSEGTGAALLSTKNRKSGTVTTPADMTHSAIYGELTGGAMFHTGRERSTFHWIVQDEIFEIRSTLTSPAGTLVWRYALGDEQTDVTVTLDSPDVAEAYLNLPLFMREPDAEIVGPANGQAAFVLDDHAIVFEWPTTVNASLRAPIDTFAGDIEPLTLAIPSDGTSITFSVYAADACELTFVE
ncbi:hypothetical protein IDH44_05070 [Paenibacillus sp. IB182496]|uniref:Uncharacterized protein n=1 Tax=Paenibacillus sabuli TaxID=2772509 RepID=A0A927BRG5_9BACL|nr:hypothetical protein [Paenibacillus sabuli]MBD2844551.1 hypothetical protein [Paenibacillus sabuli]